MKKIILLFVISLSAGKLMSSGFIIGTTSLCASSIITFTDTTTSKTVVNWIWYFGDDSIYNGSNIVSHKYDSSGVYTVSCKLYFSDSTTDSVAQLITIYDAVHAEFTAGKRTILCPELLVQFSNHSWGEDSLTYQWDFGDTLSMQYNYSTLSNPLHNYSFSGDFDVTLIVTSKHACSDTLLMEKFVSVGGPYGTFSVDTTSGCVPLKATFTFNIVNPEEKDTLILFYGDGSQDLTTFIGAPMKHIYTQPGAYIPFIQLIKWEYDNNTGQLERCTRGFINQDTIFVYGKDDILDINLNKSIKIYPNPANNHINIDCKEGIIQDILIYDVIGREVKQASINQAHIVLDISSLQAGMYIVKVATEGGILTRKIQIIR